MVVVPTSIGVFGSCRHDVDPAGSDEHGNTFGDRPRLKQVGCNGYNPVRGTRDFKRCDSLRQTSLLKQPLSRSREQ